MTDELDPNAFPVNSLVMVDPTYFGTNEWAKAAETKVCMVTEVHGTMRKIMGFEYEIWVGQDFLTELPEGRGMVLSITMPEGSTPEDEEEIIQAITRIAEAVGAPKESITVTRLDTEEENC